MKTHASATETRLHDLCRNLKLSSMAETALRLAEQSKRHRTSPLDFLLELLDHEVERRSARTAARRVKEAGFPLGKTLESFDFGRAPKLPESRLRELVAGDFIRDRRPAILIGDTGTGKTHLAEAIGTAAARRGTRVLFHTAASLVTELSEAKDARELGRLQKRLARFELVILDELGYLPLSRADADMLFRIIADRSERGSILVTTNLPFGEWTSVFPDARLCRAVVDRLTFKAEIIDTGTESERFRQSLKRGRQREAGDPGKETESGH